MTKIEWCDASWNPVIGCSRISEECRRCYAATAAASPRLQQFPQYQGVSQWDGTINFAESQLRKPLAWRQPKRIFVCSMSDLFHENVSDEWRDRIFAVMALAPQHIYQALTKRTKRMADYFATPNRARWIVHQALDLVRDEQNPIKWKYGVEQFEVKLPLANVWLGTTAGCQSSVNERLPVIDKLTQAGWTTFVSAEPLLEEVNLGFDFPGYRVHQVITGAESGRGARPMKEEWVRSLRDQCQSAGVAFFYKQDYQKSRKISLPELDGRQWVEFPKVSND
jgi:protein gp37